MVTTILSWVLTYALHSTVLILSIWLVCRYVPRLSLATQEVLWKLALGGAIVTSAIQLGAGVEPPWGHFSMPQALATEAVQTTSSPSASAVSAPSTIQHRAGDLTIVAKRTPAAAAPVVASAMPNDPGAWPWVLFSLVVAGSTLGLVRVGLAARTLRKQLAPRRDVIEDPLLETWLALCNKAQLAKRVRLSASASLPSPVALVRREVCVPERAIDGLTPQQQESMLAHELAHVIRRDPAWLVASTVIEALFFFQPLHHLVRRKIEEVAEFRCDDWAARHSGTGVHLAKCLAEVATWVEHQPTPPMVATMASARSPILRRISRLLDDKSRVVSEMRPAWRAGAALGLLGAVAWLTPGVTAQARTIADAPRAASNGASSRIVVEDIGPSGLDTHDRARVRIVGGDETVELDVAAPRPLPPPPPARPAAPPPPPRSSDMRIIIQGGWSMHGWPFFGPSEGYIGIEMDGLDMWFDDDSFEIEMEAMENALELQADIFEEQAEAFEAAAEHAAEAAEREAAEAAREAARADRFWAPAAAAPQSDRASGLISL